MLGMSRSWVRKERFNRRRGLPHTLTIDPVMIGSTPRYRQSEVMDWVESLKNEATGSQRQRQGCKQQGAGPACAKATRSGICQRSGDLTAFVDKDNAAPESTTSSGGAQ